MQGFFMYASEHTAGVQGNMMRGPVSTRGRVEADLEASIGALFRRCPALCGFLVLDAARLSRDALAAERASGLFVTEVSVYPPGGAEAARELCGEIVAALLRLIDECPAARELLRERSFARAFH